MTTANAFPIAPTTANIAMLERDLADAHDHLSREVRSSGALQDRVAELEALLTAECNAREAAVKRSAARLWSTARHHAREVIWSWRNVDKHVPRDWTAAHPPDDLTAQVLAEALGEDGFAAYCEAFRAAWREEVEAIADAAEVRHGSGRVKI